MVICCPHREESPPMNNNDDTRVRELARRSVTALLKKPLKNLNVKTIDLPLTTEKGNMK
jgi:hypothetical protein